MGLGCVGGSGVRPPVSIVPGDLFWYRPVPLVLSSIGGGFLFPRAPGLLLNVSVGSLCDSLPCLSLGDLPLALENRRLGFTKVLLPEDRRGARRVS